MRAFVRYSRSPRVRPHQSAPYTWMSLAIIPPSSSGNGDATSARGIRSIATSRCAWPCIGRTHRVGCEQLALLAVTRGDDFRGLMRHPALAAEGVGQDRVHLVLAPRHAGERQLERLRRLFAVELDLA